MCIQRNSLSKIVLSTVLVIINTGCITGRTSQTKESQYRYRNSADAALPTKKAGGKSNTTQVEYGPTNDGDRKISDQTLINFITSHLDSSRTLNDEDLSILRNLPRGADPKSMTAAAIILGMTKRYLSYLEEPSETTAVAPLERQLGAYELDLIPALQSNPYLQDLGAHQLITNALLAGTDSPSFIQNALAVTKSKAKSWESLVEAQNSKASSRKSAQRVTMISAADLRSGDALLMEAQALANQGRFKDALARMELIPEENPLFPQAKERIKDFSNRAVSDLRQKAAQAFKSSIPVSDPKAKIAYLQQARNYLEEALKGFPDADHLATVKENLSVITQDLIDLEASSADAE